MPKIVHAAVACLTVLICNVADAVPVTSLPGSTAYRFAPVQFSAIGTQTIAPGITWSTDAVAIYGWTGQYYFEWNGYWNAPFGMPYIATASPTGTMSITFDTPVEGVGAFLNYERGGDGGTIGPGVPAVIAVYDASNTLLESTTLSFWTGDPNSNDLGEFHGFLHSSADIASIRFTGSFIAATNLQVVAVPEPGSYALMLTGLAALGFAVKRRLKS